mgnify:CR=1 FL=1
MTLKPDIDALCALSLLTGVACVVIGGSTFFRKLERYWLALSRCTIPAYILTAIVLFWATLWLYVMPLGFVVALRPALPILFLVATVLTCIFCKELLMCRAIGGLFVLLPTPLLSASAWHPSLWRYVMVVFAYAMVIEGMFVVGMPWTLRNQISWSFRNKLRAKIIGGVFVALGILFIVLSFAAYRLPASA